jgi:CheY-like chemotaxis protein
LARNKNLLVEDEPRVCELIKELLVKDGDCIIIASDGVATLRRPELIGPT